MKISGDFANYSSCVKGVFQNPLTCKTFLSNQNPNWAKYFLCGNATSATFDKVCLSFIIFYSLHLDYSACGIIAPYFDCRFIL